ncbi:MAG TPA: ABC transporter permease [Planctomycetota bacterium]|nr:ABC transporter permease [Planctomycetota bacterium]
MSGMDAAMEAILRISTPLLLAGLGELILERAGVINIGAEGVMLCGAFFGFLAGWGSGCPWIGACAGMIAGVFLMLLFASFAIRFKADQIVTGMALNLLALGLTGTGNEILRRASSIAPQAVTFEPMIPSLSHLPLLGPLLFSQTALSWLAILLVPALYWYFEFSERGMELRAVGENPVAAEASGISVLTCRWKACIAAGALAGLGGAFLTISQTASFSDGCTRGRGFVAISAVVLGRYSTGGTAAACLFFGAAFYARDAFPSLNVPTELVEMLPYALTLVALCIKFGRSSAPAGLGKAYGGS